MKIVYIGFPRGTSDQRAKALRNLGHEVILVNKDTPEAGPAAVIPRRLREALHARYDLGGINRAVLRLIGEGGVDIVWADKTLMLSASTLRRAKQAAPNLALVYYSPDDNLHPGNQTVRMLRALPHYDLIVTTKSYNVPELKELGARRVLFIDNAFSPEQHRPVVVTPEDKARLGCAPVGFVGYVEQERLDMMDALAKNGVPIVYRCGMNWDPKVLRPKHLHVVTGYAGGDDYARFLCGCDINLGFLRKSARDRQTTRSVEIPACGAFMLAERTDEHLQLFREGVEAEFFGDYAELLRKIRHYLAHPEEARRIADNGRRRCLESGYSNERRLGLVLSELGK